MSLIPAEVSWVWRAGDCVYKLMPWLVNKVIQPVRACTTKKTPWLPDGNRTPHDLPYCTGRMLYHWGTERLLWWAVIYWLRVVSNFGNGDIANRAKYTRAGNFVVPRRDWSAENFRRASSRRVSSRETIFTRARVFRPIRQNKTTCSLTEADPVRFDWQGFWPRVDWLDLFAFSVFCRIHHNQIVVNRVLVPVIDSLREHAKTRVHNLRVRAPMTECFPFLLIVEVDWKS